MRFVKLMFAVMGVGAVAAAAVTGCGSSTTTGTGANPTTASGSTTGPSGSTSSGSTKTCAPKATCTAADKTCIGLVDNTGKTKFGLRMSELDVKSPSVLATGAVANIIGGAVLPNVASCNVGGSATFNWLLQFDTTAGTLRTGGAKPVADPTKGYSFDMDMITQGAQTFSLAPISFTAKPDATGAFSVTTGQHLIVPIFLDAGGTMVVLLPLNAARLTMGKLSTSQNCIGSYNDGTGPTALQVSDNCNPDPMATPPITSFVDGASLDGYITLEDADTVDISALGQTLCVLLSGSATMYGDGASPTVHCKRTGGKIDYQGSWCSTTNAAAASGCADAVQLTADFAASSVLINN